MTADETIKSLARKTVFNASFRLTPKALQSILLDQFPHQLPEIKKAIKELMTEGDLVYTYQFGCSFIERSFNRSVKITDHITLVPETIRFHPNDATAVVRLRPGAAFGSGDHPTTRLGLMAITEVLENSAWMKQRKGCRALDIGTGTGVLAIAAVLLGVDSATGIDIDPCARAEAGANVKLNGMESRIQIVSSPMENDSARVHLVTANLRYPTLKCMCENISAWVLPGGFAVLTGYKAEEEKNILDCYTGMNFKPQWRATEKDWVCHVFEKLE